MRDALFVLRSRRAIEGGAAFRTLARLHGHSITTVHLKSRHHGCTLARRLAQNNTTKSLIGCHPPVSVFSCPFSIPTFCLFGLFLINVRIFSHLSYCILIFFHPHKTNQHLVFCLLNSDPVKYSTKNITRTTLHKHSQPHSDKRVYDENTNCSWYCGIGELTEKLFNVSSSNAR